MAEQNNYSQDVSMEQDVAVSGIEVRKEDAQEKAGKQDDVKEELLRTIEAFAARGWSKIKQEDELLRLVGRSKEWRERISEAKRRGAATMRKNAVFPQGPKALWSTPARPVAKWPKPAIPKEPKVAGTVSSHPEAMLSKPVSPKEPTTAGISSSCFVCIEPKSASPQGTQDAGIVHAQRGESLKKLRARFAGCLRHGVLNEDAEQCWKKLCSREGIDVSKESKPIIWALRKSMDHVNSEGGIQAVEQLRIRVRERYGDAIVDQVPVPKEWREPGGNLMPKAIQNTEHTLFTRQTASEWDVYIDETGEQFSEDENGMEGRVVAVCVSPYSKLSILKDFHATEEQASTVMRRANQLLQSHCGLLGFRQTSIDVKSIEGWLQSILELVKWVWRLLPLPAGGKQTTLRFHVEQRCDFTPEMQSELSKRVLMATWARENPQRARQIHLESFSFVDKDEPMLAWADVVVFLWGRVECDLFKGFQDCGQMGTSLVECGAPALKVCDSIASGDMPDGEAWTTLMKDIGPSGSLQRHMLDVLSQRCMNAPKHWETYARAMRDYLDTKQYVPEVLEHMSEWLRPMKSPGIIAEYFWRSSELARLNHQGSIDSDSLKETIAELERLTPAMTSIDYTAQLHVALRMAVLDCNAFNFKQAEKRLSRWNPDDGGALTGMAQWDGKILSSLGQLHAFQGNQFKGVQLFLKAQAIFSEYRNYFKKEANRQKRQTGTYLAVALMDCPKARPDQVRMCVEKALDMSVPLAAEKWGSDPGIEDNPYPHYLLARYLAYAGTEEERAPYVAWSHRWTEPDRDLISGHPWVQIQYFRWLMADEDNVLLQQALKDSLSYAIGEKDNPTVKLIGAAVGIAMGAMNPSDPDVQASLGELEARMPCAAPIVEALRAASPGDRLLARRVLPFNYC